MSNRFLYHLIFLLLDHPGTLVHAYCIIYNKKKSGTSLVTIEFSRIKPVMKYRLKICRSFQAVVYLGGLTDRAICQDHPNDVEQENVKDIYKLAKRMLPSQLLIFASTSEIAEGFWFGSYE